MPVTPVPGIHSVDAHPSMPNSNFQAAGVFVTATDCGEPSASQGSPSNPASGFAQSGIFGDGVEQPKSGPEEPKGGKKHKDDGHYKPLQVPKLKNLLPVYLASAGDVD